jgi:protein phosphatase
LTEDHSLVNDCIRSGLLDPNQAETSRFRHVITRSVGVRPDLEIDTRVETASPGDTYLLSTDGLHGVLHACELEAILLATEEPERAVKDMIQRANEKGGPDNIAAVVVRLTAERSPE